MFDLTRAQAINSLALLGIALGLFGLWVICDQMATRAKVRRRFVAQHPLDVIQFLFIHQGARLAPGIDAEASYSAMAYYWKGTESIMRDGKTCLTVSTLYAYSDSIREKHRTLRELISDLAIIYVVSFERMSTLIQELAAENQEIFSIKVERLFCQFNQKRQVLEDQLVKAGIVVGESDTTDGK